MPLLIHKNGTKELRVGVGADLHCYDMWRIVTGRASAPTPELSKECADIMKVILNWKTAPEDYVRAHLNEIVRYAVAEWKVDRKGNPIHPASQWGWDFAHKYGLMSDLGVTDLVKDHQTALF